MNNHTSDIRTNKKSTGMVPHFADCGMNNIQPIILERVQSSDPFIRKAREQFYIDFWEQTSMPNNLSLYLIFNSLILANFPFYFTLL